MFGGGTPNAPLINYYEHGTFLTLNHAHTALFGAVLMAWDFLLKLGPLYPALAERLARRGLVSPRPEPGE